MYWDGGKKHSVMYITWVCKELVCPVNRIDMVGGIQGTLSAVEASSCF